MLSIVLEFLLFQLVRSPCLLDKLSFIPTMLHIPHRIILSHKSWHSCLLVRSLSAQRCWRYWFVNTHWLLSWTLKVIKHELPLYCSKLSVSNQVKDNFKVNIYIVTYCYYFLINVYALYTTYETQYVFITNSVLLKMIQ